tara:strand:+ start:1193 stop:1396 length:204 start_codon:yes stop_codon:yes gene_type:complete
MKLETKLKWITGLFFLVLILICLYQKGCDCKEPMDFIDDDKLATKFQQQLNYLNKIQTKLDDVERLI